MFKKLQEHLQAGRLEHEDLHVLNRHFITPDGDAIEYSLEGFNRERNKLEGKALRAFRQATDRAAKLGILAASGLIKPRQEPLIELASPSKPNFVLKPAWVKAIRRYFDELERG